MTSDVNRLAQTKIGCHIWVVVGERGGQALEGRGGTSVCSCCLNVPPAKEPNKEVGHPSSPQRPERGSL